MQVVDRQVKSQYPPVLEYSAWNESTSPFVIDPEKDCSCSNPSEVIDFTVKW